MNVEELMIGDWVYNMHHKKNIRITPFDFFTHRHAESNEQYLMHHSKLVSGKDFEPIPLTTDILEKNGFEKRNDGCIWFGEKGDTIVILWKESNYTKSYNYLDAEIGCVTVRELPITYVHELQHFIKLMSIDKEIIIEL